MNTLEKRKLEGIITTSLQDARTAYKERRQRELNALVSKSEKNIPTKVQAIIKKCDDTKADYTRKSKDIDERSKALEVERSHARTQRDEKISLLHDEAKKLGYALSTFGDSASVSLAYDTQWTGRYGNTSVRTYSEPTLTAHDRETAEHTQKLDDMATEYAIAVWADGGDMSNLLERFTKDLRAIV